MIVMICLLATGSLFAQTSNEANTNTGEGNIINVTVGGNSGNGTYQEGLMNGEMMAKGNGWAFWSGCCLSPSGFGFVPAIVFAVTEPSVPMEMVMGKSPEYIQGFRQGYINKARGKNIKNSLIGCGVGSCLTTVAVYAYVALVYTAAYSSY